MREVLKKLGSSLRAVGFRGSGQYFHKKEGDFIFVVNFQGSRWGDVFYVNLGAQPVFIPNEVGVDQDPKRLKEYQCIHRKRVGDQWRWKMSDAMFGALKAELLAALKEFFIHTQSLWNPSQSLRLRRLFVSSVNGRLMRAPRCISRVEALRSATLIKRQRWPRWA